MRCGHWQLQDYSPRQSHDDYASLDADAYRRSMEPERRTSAIEVIDALQRAGATGPLLDVGCSYGWLLTAAQAAGFESYGLEPSPSVTKAAQDAELAVRAGTFPEEHWGRSDWGVISFMDVLEHIQNIERVLGAVAELLRPGGHLAIQAPVTDGPVFRAALLLERLSGGRLSGPLRRMFQTEFEYPHVHYFSSRSLRRTLEMFGFEVVSASFRPIATDNYAYRVAWSRTLPISGGLQALGLRSLLLFGRALRRYDLLQVVARRTNAA